MIHRAWFIEATHVANGIIKASPVWLRVWEPNTPFHYNYGALHPLTHTLSLPLPLSLPVPLPLLVTLPRPFSLSRSLSLPPSLPSIYRALLQINKNRLDVLGSFAKRYGSFADDLPKVVACSSCQGAINLDTHCAVLWRPHHSWMAQHLVLKPKRTHTRTQTLSHTYTHKNTHTHTHKHTEIMHARTHARTHTNTHTHKHTHKHIVYMYTYVVQIYLHLGRREAYQYIGSCALEVLNISEHTHISECANNLGHVLKSIRKNQSIEMLHHIHIQICMCVFINTHIQIYMCIYI